MIVPAAGYGPRAQYPHRAVAAVLKWNFAAAGT